MITPEISQKMDEILHRMSHTQDHSQQFFIDFRKELKGTFFKEELVELEKFIAECKEILQNPQKKKELIKSKGGKCSICGYDKYYGALEFHHLDPSKKDFTISNFTYLFEN